MSEPIKIVVTAETAEAAAKLQAFLRDNIDGLVKVEVGAAHAAAPLRELRESAMAAHEGFRTLETSAMLLGGQRFPELAMGVMGATEGMRAMRSVALLTGLTLGELLPPLALLAAGLAGGAWVWSQFSNAQSKADEETKKLVDSLDKIPALLEKIQTLSKAGLLSPAGAKQMSDEVTGRKALYVDPAGNVTTQAGEMVPEMTTMNPSMAMGTMGAGVGIRTPTGRDVYQANRPATNDEAQKYEESKVNEISSKNAGALASFRDLEKEINKVTAEGSTALDKQIADVNSKYDELVLKVKNAAEGAGAPLTPNGVRDAKVDSEAAADIAALEADRQRDLDKAKLESEQTFAAKSAETDRDVAALQNKIREAAAKQAKEQLQAVEDEITADEDAAGNRRGALAQQEYRKRLAAANQALQMGGIDEEEYTHLVEDAAHKRTEAERAYNAQLERSAQLRKEIAQADAQAQLNAIDRNPMLTGGEKAQQSVPLWKSQLAANQSDVAAQQGVQDANPANSEAALQAQAKKNELLAQQADLQEKINAAENENNLGYQMDVVITKLQNVGTLAQQTAAAFGAVWAEATNTISSNLSKVIEGTETWRKAMINIYNSILNEVVNSIMHMAVQWLLQHTLMAAISAAFHTQDVAQTAVATQTKVAIHGAGESQMTVFTAIGAAARNAWHLAETVFHGVMVAMRVAAHEAGEILCTLITGTQAAIRAVYHMIVAAIAAMESEASVPIVGVILGIAAAAAIVAAAAGLMGGFEAGGYTGDLPTNQVAGVVHGGEFVIPAGAVNRIGLGNLEALRNGSRNGSGANSSPAGAPGASNNVTVHTWMDSRAMADALERDDAHEKYVVDVMRRNIHKFRG
jgi:hypothetical protein